MVQTIVITSDVEYHCLPAFIHQWWKYYPADSPVVICGYTPVDLNLPENFTFHSIGNFEEYPPGRWSDALIKILDTVAEDIFTLLLGDYWLIRPADTHAIQMIADYMQQFQYVIRFDLTTDRLFADGGSKYNFGYHTYDTLGYLDLIKSDPGSPYHMSLWGAMWRRDLLRRILVRGETPQQIEINGTGRLSQFGNEMLVLGTRQSPIRHANVIQRGEWNQDAMTGLPALKPVDLEELRQSGYV